MGCIHSSGNGPAASENRASVMSERKQKRPAKYLTADPDFGWRNVTGMMEGYPASRRFSLKFQNERSGQTQTNVDLVLLALNIAERASRLANKFGVAVQEKDWQSSTNLLSALSADASKAFSAGGDESERDVEQALSEILKLFGCPKFGWKLRARMYATEALIKISPEIFLSLDGQDTVEAIRDQHKAKAVLAELAAIPEYLQLFENKENEEVLMDVGEFAMNIAEQLRRLEKAENVSQQPGEEEMNTFGWRRLPDTNSIGGGIGVVGIRSRSEFVVAAISSVEGEAMMFCPEELIMNVASWVQETYLTAPAF